MKSICLLTSVLILSFSSQNVLASSEVQPRTDIPEVLQQYISSATFKEKYMSDVLSVIYKESKYINKEKATLSQADIDALKSANLDQKRHEQVRQLMEYDNNFDGKVTKEEFIEALSKSRSANEVLQEEALKKYMAFDKDKDGVVAVPEMAFITEEVAERSYGRRDASKIEGIFALDPNKDGVLTADELRTVAAKYFDLLDKDKDSVLSKEEKEVIEAEARKTAERMLEERRAERRARASIEDFGGMVKCDLPKPASGEKLVFLGVYEGKAISTMSVAGQVAETNVIPVDIAKGKEKLVIVASSFSPAIWQLTGDTSRVAKFVAAGRAMEPGTDNNDSGGASEKINIGVTGITADKVEFKRNRACGFSNLQSGDELREIQAKATLAKIFGTLPDVTFMQYDVGALAVAEDGRVTEAKKADLDKTPVPVGFNKRIWSDNIIRDPRAFIDLKDVKIISDAPAESYTVVPRWAGVAQLVENGSLVGLANRANGFKIVKPIPYYPTGLTGFYTPSFLVGKGIKPPQGGAGFSCVVSEETGENLTQGMCH